MPISTSTLRGNIYKLLDQVLESGQPLEIERKGKLLKIIRYEQPSKMAKLVKHKCLNGDPESIVHMDWSKEWHDDLIPMLLYGFTQVKKNVFQRKLLG